MQSKHRSTWKIVGQIRDYLYGFSLIAIPVIVNILTLNVKMSADESTNSVLLILPKGCAKTTLLHGILQRSNPEQFPQLPEKLFESEILKEPDKIFQNKVWVEDDLITTFRGTSTKQRDQLMGFFSTLLTKGEYGRRHVRKKGRILCVFGLAKERWKNYKKGMFEATFSDRFAPIILDFDNSDKLRILEHRSKTNPARELPTVKLPLKKKPVEVKLPAKLNREIHMLAMFLDSKGVMSFARAQTFIINFLKANADLNGRKKVEADDLMLFKFILPLHFGARSGSVDMKVREVILDSSMKGKKIAGRKIKDRVVKSNDCSERAVQSVLSTLREGQVVHFEKASRKTSGYDYMYWL